MNPNKKSFILYRDQRDVFEALGGKGCKELILAMFDFASGNNPKLSSLSKMAFISIKNQLVRDNDKWERNSEMRKGFGRLGGIAKASKSYLKPVLLSKPAVNVNDNVNVIKREENSNSSYKKDIVVDWDELARLSNEAVIAEKGGRK